MRLMYQSESRVSIHVPLAEHDTGLNVRTRSVRVSIHVPLAEHDRIPLLRFPHPSRFNSRAPRGARQRQQKSAANPVRVSIHVPLAEHDLLDVGLRVAQLVSIHVPLAEHDLTITTPRSAPTGFQFTCPSRSTTRVHNEIPREHVVSIHVPLAEHDLSQ